MSRGRILFLHPDLGLGGAERLVVDAAVALKSKDYSVKFITSHHDPNHCFVETIDGSLEVKVVGEWLPRHLFGRFFALFAYLKMLYCALYVMIFEKADCVFCDLVSVGIPLLKLFKTKVIFYCHFPDQLLSKEEGLLKRLYRMPLNSVDATGIRFADKVYVNSAFTKEVFKATFPSIKIDPEILYPSINTSLFDDFVKVESKSINERIKPDNLVFLSLNRYERKKNVELSIKSFKSLESLVPADVWNKCLLVIAGGHDERVLENVQYYSELRDVAKELNVEDKVIFFKSPSDAYKVALINLCDCLIYTPHNEHFGIVPLEGMYCKKPVIAVKSGGPTETIVDMETGFLCDSNPTSFSLRMKEIIMDEELRRKMGNAGHKRFVEKFSFEAFSLKLKDGVSSLLEDAKNR